MNLEKLGRWVGLIAARKKFASFIDHPIGRIICKAQADGFDNAGDGAFFEAVQERLDTASPNATQRWFHAMLKDIRALPATSAPSPASTNATPAAS